MWSAGKGYSWQLAQAWASSGVPRADRGRRLPRCQYPRWLRVYHLNIGSFGDSDECREDRHDEKAGSDGPNPELSDASVPFNFDIHALFFSKDAVGIETRLHEIFAPSGINAVNLRREFFGITPAHAKLELSRLAGELLQFQDMPEALEYRQCLLLRKACASS